MRAMSVGSARKRRGEDSRPRATSCTVIFVTYAITAAVASADSPEIRPDPPVRRAPKPVGPGNFRPSWDLDGIYLWLGPTGAASHVDAGWDSTFGANLAIVRIREREPVAAIGADLGASLWTARGGGRIWMDGVVGTRIGARIYGLTAGLFGEFSALEHPRYGGSVGAWAFFGITPFVRIGAVQELGGFVDVGVHIALPVLRR